MANTSYNLNTNRVLNQIGGGFFGSGAELLDTLINSDTATIKWLKGTSNKHRITAGSSQGASDIASTSALGDVDQVTLSGLPASPIWIRLYSALGNGPETFIDKLYVPVYSGVWNDAEIWDDSTVWTDA